MQGNAVTASRRLLPRWRTLARTPTYEIPATRKPAKQKVSEQSIKLKNVLSRWEQSKTLIHAADLLDAALVSGNYLIAAPAARGILEDGNGVSGLNDAARQILGELSDRPIPSLNSADERDEEQIQQAISSLKWRLRIAPRDALAALEIARSPTHS